MHLHSSVRALISLFETPEKLHRSFPLYDGVIIPNLVTQAKRCGRLSHTNQRTCTGFHIIYTPWVKKGDTPLLLSISLLNIDRFSQFFHRRTQLLHYLVKCWKRNRKTSNNLNQVSCLTINQQIFNELHEPYPRQLMQSVTTNTQKLMSSSSPKAAGVCATGRWHHQSFCCSPAQTSTSRSVNSFTFFTFSGLTWSCITPQIL